MQKRLRKFFVIFFLFLLALTAQNLFSLSRQIYAQTPPLSRGYLTTPQELTNILQKATLKIEPYYTAVKQVQAYADNPNKYTNDLKESISCPNADTPQFLKHASPHVYSLALSYHLTKQEQYAQKAITLLDQVTVIKTTQNTQCNLNLSWYMPGFIWAADLLEGHPAWTQDKKTNFQNFLASYVYGFSEKTLYRANNWGTAGAYTTALIADYVSNRQDITLLNKTPSQAYSASIENAKARINGTLIDACSSCCDRNPASKSMILPNGGIPDEIRRGGLACYSTTLNEKATTYSQVYLGSVFALAELMLRRGDSSLYDNISTTASSVTYKYGTGVLLANRGSIYNSLLFLTQNTTLLSSSNLGIFEIGNTYYNNSLFQETAARKRPLGRSGQTIHFTTLTHGLAPGEVYPPRPTTPAP